MKIFKHSVIFLMLATFLVSALTGIVRVPETQKYFSFVYNFISASQLALIHDWSGVLLVLAIVIHLIIKKKWFAELLGEHLKLSEKTSKIIFTVIGLFLLGLGAFYAFNLMHQPKTIDLSPIEIKEYQGEKLGSINDFRENSIKGVQYIDKNQYQLEISGLVEKPAKLSYTDLLKLPSYQKVVQLDCVEGWSVKALWKGILVRDLLQELSIKPEAKAVIFYAADGYSTSFPLKYILNNDILMAYNLNGVELPPERGFPFQLVAEQKWGYKWIRWITKIELSDNVNYKGFWESRGYNNNGDLSGSKYEVQ